MFFDAQSPLVDSVSRAVIYPDFDEREIWLKEHHYDPENVNWCNLDVGKYPRDKGILKYYACYTVDNIYEYYVFRSLIIHLNKLGALTGDSQFTLGHYKPFKKGGEHFPSNWIIQTLKDNSRASDVIPDKKEKWTWHEQMGYIIQHMPQRVLYDEKLVNRCAELIQIVKGFY
ncbi:hypothetical protein bas61_0082 [Escherichia phage EmilieFrey]|nr:hypothetical protein bas61_0082 [Escherichia phage EmilieFrey]